MTASIIQNLSIVIPAAGEGLRLGLGPKALLTLQGKSLLYWVSQKARQVAAEVIVAVPPDKMQEWAEHCPGCQLIAGGNSHLESMTALAKHASKEIVMNLNVVMPFASVTLIRKVVEAARESGIAGAFLELDLPLAQIDETLVTRLTPKQGLAIASGPNAYMRQQLIDLIEKADADDWRRQSFLEIAIHHGVAIKAVSGERNNIKITNQDDWASAQLLVSLLS